MKKLASLIDEIVAVASEHSKIATDAGLSKNNRSPTISTDLGRFLLKTANALRTAEAEISYDDLRNFIERARNA